MTRVSLILSCQLLALVLTTTATFGQSSVMNRQEVSDTNVNHQSQLVSTTISRKIEGDLGSSSLPAAASVNTGSESLPDKPEPNVGGSDPQPGWPNTYPRPDSPSMGYGAYSESNRYLWTLTAAVVSSNVAAIELLQGCLGAQRCRSVPSPLQGRPAMYATGLGVASGVSYVGYYLKRREVRWWFVPGVMATAFDLVFVIRAAKRQ
jgi:hypothetical protein